MSALETFGERQQQLLRYLLQNQSGATVDELSKVLRISRNAVNQHIASLESGGLIASATQPQSRGRPSNVYSLTAKGRELFPRHYDLFSNLLLQAVKQNLGEVGFRKTLEALGQDLAKEFSHRVSSISDRDGRMKEIAMIMHELGYEAHFANENAHTCEIIASNCVFHKLAESHPDVCHLDISLISNLLGEKVEHRECMVREGSRCRFGPCGTRD